MTQWISMYAVVAVAAFGAVMSCGGGGGEPIDETREAPMAPDGPTPGAGEPLGADSPTPVPSGNASLHGPADKLDLLFMIDNSISMLDKQEILAQAVPDLVRGVVDELGIDDLHVGVVTSSLGGYGAAVDCELSASRQSSEQGVDMAHLLASLPRGRAAAPSAAESGFLAWTAGGDADGLVEEFSNLVSASGEHGCGWEATLEGWYRFLIEPNPYTRIVRQQCPGRIDDPPGLCAGPELDPATGSPFIDQTILRQRAQFLRPDSLLVIVMLSEENDCSFRAGGQAWRLAQSVTASGAFSPAFRGTAACSDPTFGPNHQCCHSCDSESPSDCPTEADAEGQTVAVGCGAGRLYPGDGVADHPNLRCFQQKSRFGVDALYPVERYSNALKLRNICPYADDLQPNADGTCPGSETPAVANPLFTDPTSDPNDPSAIPKPPRPQHWILLAGILGVPWQDLAVSPDPNDVLVYKLNDLTAPEANRLNWDWLIGERYPEHGIPKPQDPLMIESIAPRAGTNPATREPLAPPSAEYRANSINGHEWNTDNSALQYACIFPREPQECVPREEYFRRIERGEVVRACDCTNYGGESYQNPLCQQRDGSYGMVQTHGKAFPSLRQLQVLHDHGTSSIVASICPKETTDRSAPDYGYRPAVNALLERLSRVLEQ